MGRDKYDRSSRKDGKKKKRSRSRSPSRKRSRSPVSRKSGFRGRSPSRKKDRGDEDLDIADVVNLDDRDLQEKKLEEEMAKRRERIQKWQMERRIQQAINEEKQKDIDDLDNKKWSLEDEDEEEEAAGGEESTSADPETPQEGKEEVKEEAKEEKMEEEKETEDDVDPLDAFMQGVNAEVKKTLNKGKPAIKATVTKIVTVTKGPKTAKEGKNKGDIIEQDADALEYSDEEKEMTIEGAMSLATKSRILPATDHSRIYYRSFRKDFYVEVPELTKLTQEEVDALREELGSIKVRGKNCPKPIRSWAQSGSARKVLDVIIKCGYETPTSIQAHSFHITSH